MNLQFDFKADQELEVVLLRDLTLTECYPARVRQRGETVRARLVAPPPGHAGFCGWFVTLPYLEGGAAKRKHLSLDYEDAAPAGTSEAERARADFVNFLQTLDAELVGSPGGGLEHDTAI